MSKNEKWRLIKIQMPSYADMSISLRPALIRAMSEGKIPNTVAVVSFEKTSLGVTYYNDPFKDVDIEAAKEFGLVVKRVGISGGGSIIMDTGCAFCLIYVDGNDPIVTKPDEMLLMRILAGMADELSINLRVPVRYRPLNDGEIWDPQRCVWKKLIPASISGIGDAIQIAGVVQVTKPDLNIAQRVLTPPSEKFTDKLVKTVSERIGSLEDILGKDVPTVEEVNNMWCSVLTKLFGVELVPGELTTLERNYMKEFRQFYDRDEWLYNRSERKFGEISEGSRKGEAISKVSGGPLLRVTVLREGEYLRDILFTGSLHARPIDAFQVMEDLLKGIKITPEEVKRRVREAYGKGISTPMVTEDQVYKTILAAIDNSRE